jgi:hypothetical protein
MRPPGENLDLLTTTARLSRLMDEVSDRESDDESSHPD